MNFSRYVALSQNASLYCIQQPEGRSLPRSVNANRGIAMLDRLDKLFSLSRENCNCHRPLRLKILIGIFWSENQVGSSTMCRLHTSTPNQFFFCYLTSPWFILKPSSPGEFSLANIDVLHVSCPQYGQDVDHQRNRHTTPECYPGRIYGTVAIGGRERSCGCAASARTMAWEVEIVFTAFARRKSCS